MIAFRCACRTVLLFLEYHRFASGIGTWGTILGQDSNTADTRQSVGVSAAFGNRAVLCIITVFCWRWSGIWHCTTTNTTTGCCEHTRLRKGEKGAGRRRDCNMACSQLLVWAWLAC